MNIDNHIIYSKNKYEYNGDISLKLPEIDILEEEKLIIMDDNLDNNDMKNDELIYILLNGKNCNISYIVTMNNILDITNETKKQF